MRHFIATLAIALAACTSQPAPQGGPEPLTLTGTITRVDHQTYREIPFLIPPSAQTITIDFAYTAKESRTVIDIRAVPPG